MTATKHPPTTEQVRNAYVHKMRDAFIASTGEHEAEFDRWLRQVQADAWRVGFDQSSGMDRGYDSRPGAYVSNDMAHEIDHWNPYTGTGYVDPHGDDHDDDCY